MRISCDELRHKTVIDGGGLAIGAVETMFVNDESWHVDLVRVRLRRDLSEQLGAEKSMFRRPTIEIPTSAIRSVGDAVLLNLKADELREGTAETTAAPESRPSP